MEYEISALRRKRRYWVLGIFLLVLSGCAAGPDISARQIEDAVLMQSVLTQDATLRLVSNECMRLHPELMPMAYKSQAFWWQRNGQWVVEADQGLNKLVLDSVERHGKPLDTTLGLSISLQTSLEAQARRDALVTEATPVSGCRALLTRYREGELDLNRDPAIAARLPRLARFAAEYYPPVERESDQMMQSLDRSQFIAQRLAQQALCEQAQLTPLVRQWPREVYNARCNANRQALIHCEWSRCQILP